MPPGTNLEPSLFYSRHSRYVFFTSAHVHRDEFFLVCSISRTNVNRILNHHQNTTVPSSRLLDHEFLDHTFHEMEIIFKAWVLQAILGNLPPENCDCVSSRFTGGSIPLARSNSRFSPPYLGYTRKLRAYNVISLFNHRTHHNTRL